MSVDPFLYNGDQPREDFPRQKPAVEGYDASVLIDADAYAAATYAGLKPGSGQTPGHPELSPEDTDRPPVLLSPAKQAFLFGATFIGSVTTAARGSEFIYDVATQEANLATTGLYALGSAAVTFCSGYALWRDVKRAKHYAEHVNDSRTL